MFIEDFHHKVEDANVKFSIWETRFEGVPYFHAKVINTDLDNYKELSPAEQESVFGVDVNDENLETVYYTDSKELKADLLAKYGKERLKSKIATKPDNNKTTSNMNTNNTNDEDINNRHSKEIAEVISTITDMITYAEGKLGYPTPRPSLERWQIGWCSNPKDSIGSSNYGFYWKVSCFTVAKKIVLHYINAKPKHMRFIENERSTDELSVRYVVVRTA